MGYLSQAWRLVSLGARAEGGHSPPYRWPIGDGSDCVGRFLIRLRRTVRLGLVMVAVGGGCATTGTAWRASTAGESTNRVFVDVAAAAGVARRHHKPILDHQLDNIMEWVCSVGAAAAAGDYDNDGWIDLYVTDSRKGWPNYLYRNNGDGTFTDVAKAAGVADLNGDHGTSMDCVWGDYDNDGWIDLYVVRWGYDVLFRNNGDGTFSDVTKVCFHKRDGSPGTEWANGNAAVFLDYNLDGRLDLYVGNYFDEVDLWHLTSTRIMHDDFEQSRNGGRNFLYRQESDGTFAETATPLGLDDPGWTLAVGSADIDNDGWPDLYCADDFGPDQLFMNNRDGTFRNVTELAIGFDTKKGMNVDFGDFNNDGWLDIFVTNITTAEYLQEGNMLWHNNGPGDDGELTFTDISLEAGAYDGGWAWGAKFFDFDNDGDLDIVGVNGFISAGDGNYWYDLASWTVTGQDPADARNWPTIGDRSFSGYERIRLWRNDGLYTFSRRARDVGLESTRDGRGVVCFDYDNDGDIDLFVANQDQVPHLYRNDTNKPSFAEGDPNRPPQADQGASKRATTNHWLTIALEVDPTTGVNRDAIGARVTLVTANGHQIRERDGGNGYSGQSDARLHFGLGAEDHVKLLEVRWPDGGLQYMENVAANQFITFRQQPDRYATQMAIAVDPPKPWIRRQTESLRRVPELEPEALERHLSDMEERLRNQPPGYTLASTYRTFCADYDQHDRSIRFFKKLVSEQRGVPMSIGMPAFRPGAKTTVGRAVPAFPLPSDLRTRVELGCAYVDKIPTCGGLAAIVSKGTLARKSLDQFDAVLAQGGDLWVVYYTRGMNHLHWPRALRHSDAAAADFEKCLELQRQYGAPNAKSYYLRPFVGLGDAYAKAKKYDRARRAWGEGLKAFPDSDELKERLAIEADKELLAYVQEQRSLEQRIDTDLSFLDREP